MESTQKTLFSVFLFMLVSFGCLQIGESWGSAGHIIICRIAQAQMSQEAKSAVTQLLPGKSTDLAEWCNWADEVKVLPGYRWSGSLHYINVPKSHCDYDYKRDCRDGQGPHGEPRWCVAGAIKYYSSVLGHRRQGQNLTEAILFLSHFIGDIHQPLHVGYASDKGGSSYRVKWFGTPQNLHQVWDSSIINKAKKEKFNNDLGRLVSHLLSMIKDPKSKAVVEMWQTCDSGEIPCPDIYATESIGIVCGRVYPIPKGSVVLTYKYYEDGWDEVKVRLAQAGVRIGATLNHIFSSHFPGFGQEHKNMKFINIPYRSW